MCAGVLSLIGNFGCGLVDAFLYRVSGFGRAFFDIVGSIFGSVFGVMAHVLHVLFDLGVNRECGGGSEQR